MNKIWKNYNNFRIFKTFKISPKNYKFFPNYCSVSVQLFQKFPTISSNFCPIEAIRGALYSIKYPPTPASKVSRLSKNHNRYTVSQKLLGRERTIFRKTIRAAKQCGATCKKFTPGCELEGGNGEGDKRAPKKFLENITPARITFISLSNCAKTTP